MTLRQHHRESPSAALRRSAGLCLMAALTFAGCAPRPVNPSFSVTPRAARRMLRAMQDRPQRLARPVVVVGGFLDPGVVESSLAATVKRHTGDDRVIGVSLATCSDFDQCRRALIEAVDAAYPGGDELWTMPVDVVGVSMGGLAARFAAAPDPADPGARRLRMVRLFTISSPHQGASMAPMMLLGDLAREMTSGSQMLEHLARTDAEADYALYPYVRLHDVLVGSEHAAPPGHSAWWVAPLPLSWSHMGAYRDPRIIADVLRRLRGEVPLATEPAAPLPG